MWTLEFSVQCVCCKEPLNFSSLKTKTKLKLKPEGLTVKLLAKPTKSAKFWTADRPLKVEVTIVNEEEAKAMYETGKLTTDMKLNTKKIKNSVGLSKSDGSYSFA